MSDTTERLGDVEVEKLAADYALMNETWADKDVVALAREVQDFRKLAALCGEHGGIERVVAMGLAAFGAEYLNQDHWRGHDFVEGWELCLDSIVRDSADLRRSLPTTSRAG